MSTLDKNQLRHVHVLLVEDNKEAAGLVSRILEYRGARVTVTTSAREALESLAWVNPDVLLTDISTPEEEDSQWLLERVRALPAGKGGTIPAVALTAADVLPAKFGPGFQAHVSKLIDPVEICDTIATVAARA